MFKKESQSRPFCGANTVNTTICSGSTGGCGDVSSHFFMTSQGRVWSPKCGQTHFKNNAKKQYIRRRVFGTLPEHFWEHFGSLCGTKKGLRATLARFSYEKRDYKQTLIIIIYLNDFTALKRVLKRSLAMFRAAENKSRNRTIKKTTKTHFLT